MHFSLQQLYNNRLGYADILKEEIYTETALTPPTPWNNRELPKKPTKVKGKSKHGSVKLEIEDKKHTARKFVIYRFDGPREGDYNDPANIIDVVYADEDSYTDVPPGKGLYTYGVTSVSDTGLESRDAKTVRVKH